MPTPTKPQQSPDNNVEKVVEKLRSRSVLGLKKYGATTEREDLLSVYWVRHWQEENMDAAIYGEKLAQEIENLNAANGRLKAILDERNLELEVLHKAVESARQSVRDLAVLWHDQFGVISRQQIEALAADLGIELKWPNGARWRGMSGEVEAAKSRHDAKHAKLQSAAKPALPKPQKLTACEQVRMERDEQWKDAQTNPPAVGHAVLGLVNGTTKMRAVYYEAKTGKWVDVNDRPVTVSQWRPL